MNKFDKRNIKIINNTISYSVYYEDDGNSYFIGDYSVNALSLIIPDVKQWYIRKRMKLEGGAEYGTLCKTQD